MAVATSASVAVVPPTYAARPPPTKQGVFGHGPHNTAAPCRRRSFAHQWHSGRYGDDELPLEVRNAEATTSGLTATTIISDTMATSALPVTFKPTALAPWRERLPRDRSSADSSGMRLLAVL